jgi:hypothetical protein
MSSIDFNDLLNLSDQSSFEPIPDGTYQMRVAKCEVKAAKSSGKDMLVTDLEVVSGPEKGKSCKNNFVLSPESANATWFFFKNMAAFGLTRQYFSANPPLSQVAKDLEGRHATVKLGQREWNDRINNEVNDIQPPSPEFANAGQPSSAADPMRQTPPADPWANEAAAPQATSGPDAPTPQEPSGPPAGLPPVTGANPPDAPF